MTPHWVGHVIRRKLGLKTQRERDGYVIADSEDPKLSRLYDKYGMFDKEAVNLVNSVDSVEGMEPPPDGEEPRLI